MVRSSAEAFLIVRVKRGADLASDLLVCQLRLNLKVIKELQDITDFRYNMEDLNRTKLEAFRISLQNCFEVLQDTEELYIKWKSTRDMFLHTSHSILGEENTRRKS